MTLTPMYDRWLEMLAKNERTMLMATFMVIVAVVVVLAFPRRRVWLLWSGVGMFWFTLAVLLLTAENPLPLTGGWLMDAPLWYDETFTAAIARLPMEAMRAAVFGDVHPPYWYYVSWTFGLVGRSAFLLRLPALIFAVQIPLFVFYITEWSFPFRRPPLWAVLLLVCMPGFLYYAQEARMYSMLTLWVSMAALGMLTGYDPLLILGCTFALYTHNLGAVYVAVIALLWMWREIFYPDLRLGFGSGNNAPLPFTGRTVLGAAWPLLVVLILWLPWLMVLVNQARAVAGGFWVPDVGLGGYVMPVYRMTFGMGAAPALAFHGAVAAVGLAALAGWVVWKHRTWPFFVCLAILTVGPALLLALISELWTPVYLERALLPSLPFLCILAAVALDDVSLHVRRPILAVLIPLLLISVAFMSKGSDSYDDMAADIAQHYRAADGDVIYHANLASYILFSYYLPEEAGYRHVVWPDAGDLSQALTLETQEAMGIRRLDAADLAAGRLLVVWIETPMVTQEEMDAVAGVIASGRQARLVATWAESDLSVLRLWEVEMKRTMETIGRKEVVR